MRELSLHILDIAANSVAAGAGNIRIEVVVSRAADLLSITISDDGKGMDAEMLRRVADPFTTTRTTRKVGMGLPLLKLAAETSGGFMDITSQKGVGTTVKAVFKISSIDRVPLGDLDETLLTLTLDAQHYDIVFTFAADGQCFEFNTADIKREIDYGEFQQPEVYTFLKSYLKENIMQISGGII